MSEKTRNPQLVPALMVAVVATLAGIWFATQSNDEAPSIDSVQRQLENTLILPEDFKAVPDFSLLDKNGESVDKNFLKDKWSLLFFGFTNCPDVCPMTLTVVSDAIDEITKADSTLPIPQVIFVSVDPKRDRPEALKGYVEYFNPDFNSLTGELSDIHSLTRPLNIVVAYTADKDDETQYTVDHSSAILLVDPELRLRAKFNSPHLPEVMASDYQVLINNIDKTRL